jgi:PhnB protein
VRVEPYVYFQGRCEEALEFYRVAIGAEATVLARFGDNVGDAEAERLFAALADGGTVQVQIAPTPFASRLGLVADRFGVPWMVVSQNATG